MTTEIFSFYLQSRLIQASQIGGQWYNDPPFSIPWLLMTRPSKSYLMTSSSFLAILSSNFLSLLRGNVIKPFCLRHWHSQLGNCNIFMKLKISVINEMKRDEISLILRVCDQENLCGILWTFVKVLDQSWPIFGHFSVHKRKLTKFV